MTPRTVRNFWISTRADDSNTTHVTGPRRADQGFTTTIEQRSQGDITTAVVIYGWVRDDGSLELEVYDHTGKVIHTFATQR